MVISAGVTRLCCSRQCVTLPASLCSPPMFVFRRKLRGSCSFSASNWCGLARKLRDQFFVFKDFLASFPLFFISVAVCFPLTPEPSQLALGLAAPERWPMTNCLQHTHKYRLSWLLDFVKWCPCQGVDKLVAPTFRACPERSEESAHAPTGRALRVRLGTSPMVPCSPGCVSSIVLCFPVSCLG